MERVVVLIEPVKEPPVSTVMHAVGKELTSQGYDPNMQSVAAEAINIVYPSLQDIFRYAFAGAEQGFTLDGAATLSGHVFPVIIENDGEGEEQIKMLLFTARSKRGCEFLWTRILPGAVPINFLERLSQAAVQVLEERNAPKPSAQEYEDCHRFAKLMKAGAVVAYEHQVNRKFLH